MLQGDKVTTTLGPCGGTCSGPHAWKSQCLQDGKETTQVCCCRDGKEANGCTLTVGKATCD